MGVPGGKAELSGEVSGSEKGVGSPSEHLSTCRALCPPSLPSGLAQVVPGAGGLREQAGTEAGGRTARDPSAEGLRSQVQGGGYASPGVPKGTRAPLHSSFTPPPGVIWKPELGGTPSGLGGGTPGSPQTSMVHPHPAGSPREPKGRAGLAWPCFRRCFFCPAGLVVVQSPSRV